MAFIRGGVYFTLSFLNAAFIEGGIYWKAAFVRGWRLEEEIRYRAEKLSLDVLKR